MTEPHLMMPKDGAHRVYIPRLTETMVDRLQSARNRDAWKVRGENLCLAATVAINEGDGHGVWTAGEYLRRTLLLQRVHPELLGIYPLPKWALRRANTLVTEKNCTTTASFPQT
uniref:Uncharacterized protein n=1 Tax=Eutreptiella gymnastica TaxID=73025 RepID=A0A7S4FV99_9EUGL